TQVQQILATSAVSLATPRSQDAPASYGGTEPATETTLYLRLAGDPEPKALPFRRTMIAYCGSGLYSSQNYAALFMRRMLKNMGILSSEHAREVRPWLSAPAMTQPVWQVCHGCCHRCHSSTSACLPCPAVPHHLAPA